MLSSPTRRRRRPRLPEGTARPLDSLRGVVVMVQACSALRTGVRGGPTRLSGRCRRRHARGKPGRFVALSGALGVHPHRDTKGASAGTFARVGRVGITALMSVVLLGSYPTVGLSPCLRPHPYGRRLGSGRYCPDCLGHPHHQAKEPHAFSVTA